MGKTREERIAELNQHKQVLLERMRQDRADKLARVRRRGRRGLIAGVVAAVFLFVATLLISQADLRSSLESFNGMCRNVHDGMPFEAVRGLASDRRLIFEPDEQAAAESGEVVFALKPERDWPSRYACKYRVREHRVYHY